MILPAEEPGGAEALLFVVIYQNPIDFPGKYVVRDQYVIGSRIESAIEPRAIVDSLDEARRRVPWGMVCLARSPEDDPVIVESWI